MEKLILLIFIILFVDSVIVLICKGYNQLVLLKNSVNSNYQQLNKEVTFRFELISKYLPIVDKYLSDNVKQNINDLINSFKITVAIPDVADLYFRLNTSLLDVDKEVKSNNFSAPEWDKAFVESNERIEKLKKEYEDGVLTMNNTIKAPGLSIIAKIFGFTEWPFFIKTQS